MIDFKGSQFEQDIIFGASVGMLLIPSTIGNWEEMMQERGVTADPFQSESLGLKYTPCWIKPSGKASARWA